MSWISRVARWVTPSSQKPVSEGGGSLVDVRRRLEQEQRHLAQDIEEVFGLYDERLQHVAGTLHTLSDDELMLEEANIQSIQDELRRILRRFAAAYRSRQQLERELGEWEDRVDVGPMHADHPKIRAEIVRSELSTRRLSAESTYTRQASIQTAKGEGPALSSYANAEYAKADDAIPIAPIQIDHLVAAIRQATRETERWHALPAGTQDQDALDQVHHVRDLHALLKKIDREQGIVRDRMSLAVRSRE